MPDLRCDRCDRPVDAGDRYCRQCGGPLSGALLSMDGAGGLAGWQWMFLIEGIPATLLGIVVLFVLAFGFAAFSVGAATFTGPKRYNRAKYDAYECGIEPTPQPMGGGRFPIKFYLVCMIFILLDVDAAFLYPWALVFRDLGVFGFVEMMVFVGLLGTGFVYAWKQGALDW